MGLGIVGKIGGGIVDRAKSATSAVVDKAQGATSTVVDKAGDVGSGALGVAKDVGSKAKEVGGDVVTFSREANDFINQQQQNFNNGVLEWGKGTVGTVVDLASHPIETAKAVDKLASNPLINPVGGLVRGAIQGKSPVETYKDGLNDVKDIGTGLYDGYKEVYDEHGIAGLAGNVAPDIALAVLSGGSSAGVKGAATVGGKAVAKEVAGEAAETAVTRTVRGTAKEIAEEFVPGPEDLVAESQNDDVEPNFLQAFLENFGG